MNFVSLLPLRQDIVEKAGDSYGTDPKALVYSGPFIVEQWVKGSKIVLKKNEKYWDAKSVKLSTANISIVPEESTRQQLFDTKGLDLIQNVKEEYAQKLKDKLDKGEVGSIIGYYPSTGYIAFNNKDTNKIFTNAKVRLAFSISIDRDGYVKNITKKDQAAYGFVPYGMNNGDKVYREAVPEPLKEAISKDPKKLLQEGLQELGLDPSKQIEVTFLQKNANADQRVIGEFYQNQWEKKLGVKVKIDTASDGATFNKMIMKGTYQIAQTGWGADFNDPMTFMGMFLTGDGNNSAFFSNKQYDELVKKASIDSDMNKRLDMFKQAEKILVVDDAAIAPLTFNVASNYMQSYVKGLDIGAGGPAYELKYVYIEKK
jgi:oligopeptide transport system substrate-binding protein